MKKQYVLFALLLLVAAVFPGCVVYMVPDEGYSGAASTTSYVNSSASGGYVTSYTSVQGVSPVYYTLKIVDNRWIFSVGNEEVSYWDYMPDGTCIRHGRDIDGIVRIFYTPDRVAAEMHFKRNIMDGDYRSYWSNGKLRESGIFTGGKRDGDWKDYDENGSMHGNYMYRGGAREKVVFESKKAFKPAKTEWDWKFMNEPERAGKYTVEPFDRNKAYPRDGGKGKRFGSDPGRDYKDIGRWDKDRESIRQDNAQDSDNKWNRKDDSQDQGNKWIRQEDNANRQDNGRDQDNRWNKQDNAQDQGDNWNKQDNGRDQDNWRNKQDKAQDQGNNWKRQEDNSNRQDINQGNNDNRDTGYENRDKDADNGPQENGVKWIKARGRQDNKDKSAENAPENVPTAGETGTNPGRDFNNKGDEGNFTKKDRGQGNNNAYDRNENSVPQEQATAAPEQGKKSNKWIKSNRGKSGRKESVRPQSTAAEPAATKVPAQAEQPAVTQPVDSGEGKGNRQGNNGRGADDSKVPYDKTNGKHAPKDDTNN